MEFYCKKSFIQVLLKTDERRLDSTQKWLIVGYPGVDGITFTMKAQSEGKSIYAHYPYEDEYIKIATSESNLIEKWKSNQLKL
jgi:hypothetical protein